MTHGLSPLWAEVVRTTFEWGRIQSNTDWILPIVVCIAILLYVRWLYRRDAEELRPTWSWLLTALRTATFLGLLIFFLQPHWRSEREEVRNSRVLLLADTSLSMGMTDEQGSASRSKQIVDALQDTDFLTKLRRTHDVTVFEFSEDIQRDGAVTLDKLVVGGDFSRRSDGDSTADPLESSSTTEDAPDWNELLAPTGVETRLGQALRQLVQEGRGSPLAGIVVMTDGCQNAGVSPEVAVALAREAKIPIFTIGLGSDRPPRNVAVNDFVVPARAYPGDPYAVTGYVQAQGMAGKTVTVQVLSRPAGDASGKKPLRAGDVLESRQIILGGDGEALPVKFELTPPETGRRTLTFRVVAPKGDANAADNAREADVEIIDRKNHVLLMADGPMRDYQFLRSLLFRDRHTTVDVLLQSGKPGMSQEAQKTLDDFPSTREELFDYDCIVAFDPNWQLLTPAQLELLDQWVGEQGGGLIVAAGPVHACRGVRGWVQDPKMSLVRNLYPVEFPGRLAAIDSSTYATREPWPLKFTREGLNADFLWLADSATASRKAWEAFPGVYSYSPVRGPKPGAAVYAEFSDPQVAHDDQLPPYFVGQFYGSGRVFYMGSAEMWRLRSVDESYFEQFYTKLIRHVSQGRLLRGSSRGALLVGQDRYMLGNTVEVRAQLSNIRLEPLEAPTVNLQIIQPDGVSRTIALKADGHRAGAYTGQFPALLEGTYRLELPVPESQGERLERRIQVRAPDLERENPRRNDTLLTAIAQGSGGKYFVGMSSAVSGPASLVEQLKDRTTTAIFPIAPDPKQEERWLFWCMIGLCGLLCLEWLIRRLLKLA